MPLDPCQPCDCIPDNVTNDKFKRDVELILCQALDALGYSFPPGSECNPCQCIPQNVPNDKFKQDVEVLLCALVTAIGGGSGGGTVTSFSFTDANGVDGTVTNPTTTPNLTINLTDITPNSVAATGTVTGSNLSGTNTGDQTISLTGDVTGFGTGSVAATIANDAVTFAKFQNITTARLLGRATAGSGDMEEITLGTGLSYTGTTLNVSGSAVAITALTGDVTATGPGSVAATIANDAVTFAKFQNITTARLLGRATAGSGDMEEITLGTGLSYTGTTLNGSMAIGETVTSGTAGSILFVNSGPILAQDNSNLFWDDTNNRLGLLAGAAPTHTLTLGSNSTGLAHFSTADQVTNFHYWLTSTSSNNITVVETRGGSNTGGGSYTITGVNGTSATNANFILNRGTLPFINMTTTATGVAGNQFQVTPLGSGSSSAQVGFAVVPTWTQSSTASATDLLVNRTETGVGSGTQNLLDLQVASASLFRIDNKGHPVISTTTTTAGTTGNQTINKPTGTVNIAAGGTTVTVTNSLCAATSLVFAVIRTNDTTARLSNVVPAAGSFVINIVACTAEVSIGFLVIN